MYSGGRSEELLGEYMAERKLREQLVVATKYSFQGGNGRKNRHRAPEGSLRRLRVAAVAEQEAEAISKRTKAALGAAKARGTKLGGRRVSAERFAEIGAAARQVSSERASQVRSELLPTITAIQATGASSLRAIAAELNAREVPTPRKSGEWSAVQVQRVMER